MWKIEYKNDVCPICKQKPKDGDQVIYYGGIGQKVNWIHIKCFKLKNKPNVIYKIYQFKIFGHIFYFKKKVDSL